MTRKEKRELKKAEKQAKKQDKIAGRMNYIIESTMRQYMAILGVKIPKEKDDNVQ